MNRIATLVLLAAVPFTAALGSEPGIRGEYLEARTADVYTGPCFANAEVGLAGKEAVMAWRVSDGSWEGVALDGLTVVAIVISDSTLGDPFADSTSRAVIVTDASYTPEQQRALRGLARGLAGDLLVHTSDALAEGVALVFDDRPGHARLTVGDTLTVATRALCHTDHFCGNEEVYYPPLADVDETRPVYTLTMEYREAGIGLGFEWSAPDKRSGFVGTFSR